MKGKIKILNIVTIFVCVIMLFFGVYALQQGVHTTNGSVGFIAHDCRLTVYGTITGATSNYDNMDQDLVETFYFGDINNQYSIVGSRTLTFENDLKDSQGQSQSIIYFNDANNTVPEIVMTFYITNNSVFSVCSSITNIQTDSNIATSVPDSLSIEPNETEQLIITLSLNDAETEVATSQTNFNLSVLFEKITIGMPTNTSLSNNVLTFDEVQGATSYEISYFSGDNLVSYYEINSNNTELDNLPTDAGDYMVKVRAKKVINNESYYSDYVEVGQINVEDRFIHFTISGVGNFTAERNMTWTQWVNSVYNTCGAIVYYNNIKIGGYTICYIDANGFTGNPVMKNYYISDNAIYPRK